jgi:hypothetical protein
MGEKTESQKEKILGLLKEKSIMKQDVFRNTITVFDMMRQVCKEITTDLKSEIDKVDKRIGISFFDINQHAMQLKVAGDMLEFYMHTNVFEFDRSHPMYKTGYIKQNELNSYCGIINIYNFLADSFAYNRLNDLGYLVARVFVNREMKFFVEAKGALGVKYNTFSTVPLNKEQLQDIIEELIVFVISFDLFTPPFDSVREVSVNEMQEKTNSINLRTGKRLGYTTSASHDDEINL